MSADPRAALAALVAAFERHLEASASRRGEEDPAVIAAYEDLADAFENYDDALLEAFGEMTPLEVYSGSEPEEDEEDFDELDDHGDEDGDDGDVYSGLDSADYDEDAEDEAPAGGVSRR